MITDLTVAQNDFREARHRLVENVIAVNGVTDTRVLDAIRMTKRHEFVPSSQRKLAYYDMALPIGEGQTISSPFIVAFMTEALDPKLTDKVLEIGTGSGYQAAVLSPLVHSVYSIEILEPLGRRAKRLLHRLKYDNVRTRIGDGFAGWPEHAPFDKIIVTCSPEDVPEPLVEQLREGGRMVIPVGERYQQTLCLMTKQDGKLVREELRPTLFVPMTGAAEDDRDILSNAKGPFLVNGSFEQLPDSAQHQHIPGWYYQRQVNVVEDRQNAPDGEHVAEFSNSIPRRSSHLLQGFALDGRKVPQLVLSGWVKLENVVPAQPSGSSQGGAIRPSITLTFYDEQRRQLGNRICGPWQGTQRWESVSKTIRVPPATREAILRVGLFGATGRFLADHLQIHVPSD